MKLLWLSGFFTGLAFGIFFTIIFFVLTLSNILSETPSAIDVYRGKTTLQVTYKDGIPIDTIVTLK